MGLRNINWTNRSKLSNLPSILVGILPLPSKYHFNGQGITTAMKEQQIHNPEVSRKAFDVMLSYLHALFIMAKLMLLADSRMWQYYPVIFALMADHFKIIHLHSIQQPHWSVCEALKLSFGEANSSSWQLGDYWLYIKKIIRLTQGGKTERGESRHKLRIERLEPQKVSSGICNASLWLLILYAIFVIPSILECLSNWWTG